MQLLKNLSLALIVLLSISIAQAQTEQSSNNACNCPYTKMEVSSKSIKEGKTVTFTVLIVDSESKNCKLTYDWTISNGKILKGQHTKRIIVKANKGTAGGTITAVAFINGDNGCENHPTKMVEILKL
jgi:hypothetical protein